LDNFDALFKLAGFDSKEYGLGATHEEIITPLAQKYAFSYKDLPFSVFQIQNKFRNEKRAKSGLLRGREFFMKDMYSFHADEEDLNNFYKTAQKAYFKIFERCGLLNKTYLTFASGGNFSKHSHEYQTLTSAGEDDIYICEKCSIAINKEIIDETKHTCPNCQEKKLRVERAVEVGNIFKLKTRFSDAFKYTYSNEAGKKQPVIMGCYGIGLGRVMGTVAEVCHDEDGLVWPKELAPFTVHLIEISSPDIEANNKIKLTAEKIYKELRENKIEVLFDDRNETSAGAKFTDADLIGCPLRLVVSERSLDQDSVEVKNRNEAKKELVKVKKILSSKL